MSLLIKSVILDLICCYRLLKVLRFQTDTNYRNLNYGEIIVSETILLIKEFILLYISTHFKAP
jgi:hypothetical protein